MKEQIEKQAIEEMAKVIEITEQIARDAHCGYPSPTMYAKDLYWKGYRKQSEGEWISVDERLPDDYQEALCLMKNGDFRVLEWSYSEWRWVDETVYWYEHDVTHWIPIPKPPKMKGGAE